MNRALWLFAAWWPLTAAAQIDLLPDAARQAVFAGSTQTIHIALRNHSDAVTTNDVTLRLFQVTAGSAVPSGSTRPWKTVRILPQQTVLEDLALSLPETRAATEFRIELIGIGRAEVMAYPTNLLQRLGTLAGDQPLGVFDPDGNVKPLLKRTGVRTADFEIEPAESKLAIVWTDGLNLPESIASHVKTGMSVVWIRSSKMPTTYAVHQGAGVVVVAPASTVHGLADSPLAQLNLIRDAELALEPDALRLPSDKNTE